MARYVTGLEGGPAGGGLREPCSNTTTSSPVSGPAASASKTSPRAGSWSGWIMWARSPGGRAGRRFALTLPPIQSQSSTPLAPPDEASGTESRKQLPSCDLGAARFRNLVSATRPAAPPADCVSQLRSSDPNRMLEGWSKGYRAALTQDGGNLSGNPGANTRRYRTAPDEIAPVPEQPGWSWTGPGGGLGTDS
jgi:hypothetical protein